MGNKEGYKGFINEAIADKYKEISCWETFQNEYKSRTEYLSDITTFDGDEILFVLFISAGRYREIFEYVNEQTKNILAFHNLCSDILLLLDVEIIYQGFRNPKYFTFFQNNENEIPKQIIYAYEKELAKLDNLFYEFAEKNIVELNKQADNEQKEWQKKLIEDNFLDNDGKRVVKSLDETVREFVNITGNPTTWRFVYNNFLKTNYLKYSEDACKKAVTFSNIR